MTERELRRIFDEDADTYERARPGYPDELIGDLVELTGLGPGRSVIEIGPGTGQATRHLLAAGAEVTAVELGPHLAARLRTRLGGTGLRVVEGAFESWEPPDRVDLIAAFTSWHWVDHTSRAARVHAALRPGGQLATVATAHARGGDRSDAFFDLAQECYLRWDPATDPDERLLTPADLDPIVDEIDDSALFGSGTRRRHIQAITYSTEEYLDVLRTYSGHRALPPERRQSLFDCLSKLIDERFGGSITKTYLYELRVASAVVAW